MLTKADAITTIKTKPPESAVSDLLLERIPFVFNEDWSEFRAWRLRLARMIEVDACDIYFMGSSATGFSLNPYKGFKDFDEISDIDLGIISAHHFDIAWRFIRTQRRSKVDNRLWSSIEEHRSNYIYWGCIAADRILSYFPFGAQWLAALSTMTTDVPTRDRNIRLRIYRDVASLRSYQASNLRNLKAAM